MFKNAILTVGLVLIIAAPIMGLVASQVLVASSSSSSLTSTLAVSYPPGNRVVRIRPLDPNSTWILPGYTANDVLGWVSDLKPTTINRYTTGSQSPNASVPVTPGQSPMTIKQFLQTTLDDMGPNPVIFPRISFKDYATSPALFMSEAQSLYTLYSKLTPTQTLLSLDNTNTYFATHNVTDAQILESQLLAIGWTGVAWGACAATNQLPNGTTFAMICVSTSNWQPDYATMSALQTQQPSIQEYEAQIDFPGPMSSFAALSPDQEAAAITNLASNQSIHGYHYMYPIMQLKSGTTTSTFAWDSTKVITSPTGPFHGESLYQVMKNLMNTYNSVGTSTPDFQMTATPNGLSFATGSSATTTISIAALNGFTATTNLTIAASVPAGLTVSCTSMSLMPGSTSSCQVQGAASGSYFQTITGTSGNLVHSLTLSVTVGITPLPDFSLKSASNSVLTMAQASASTTLTIASLAGFSGTVTLTASTNSTGMSCTLSSSRIAHSSGLTNLSCSSSTAANYLATVNGNSGALSHSVAVVFHVQDFAIKATPGSFAVIQSSSVTTTITLSSLNGFSGTFALAGTVSPSGPILSFSPTTVTSSGESATSTLTLSLNAGTHNLPSGNYVVNITATSGPSSHSTTVQVSVTPSGSSPSTPLGLPLTVLAGSALLGIGVSVAVLLAKRRTASLVIDTSGRNRRHQISTILKLR